MMLRIFQVVLIAFLLAPQAHAQEVYEINTQYPVHSLDPVMLFMEVEEDTLELNDILGNMNLSFKPRSEFPAGHFAFKPGSTVWAKAKLMTPDSLKGWTLHFEDRRFRDIAWIRGNGRVDVWGFIDDELIFHKKTGTSYAKSERDIPEKWIMNRVNLELPVDKVVDLVVRLDSNVYGMNPFFNTYIRSPEQPYYFPVFPKHANFNVFLFGVTFIVFLYHLLMFFYTKRRIFMWFTVWLFFAMFTQSMTIGFNFEHFYGNLPQIRYPLWMFISTTMVISFWFFGRSYTRSYEKFPFLDKVILGLTGIIGLEILVNIIWIAFGEPKIVYTGMGIHYKLLILYGFVGLILAVAFAVKKDMFAKYFGVGAIFASSSIFIGGLWSEGLFKPGFDPYAWGIFSQVIIYSFGIAFRQRQLDLVAQQEKLHAVQSDLEIERMKDLDSMKSRFFANISHEFRTPLSLITGPLKQAKIVKSPNGNEELRLDSKNYSIIEKNAKRLQNLVDQLLDLAKMESNQLHLNLSQGQLISFIRSIVFSFESLAERRNISLNTHFPSEIPHAYFDKDKLEKMLSNLLSNAFKYSDDGGSVNVIVHNDKTHFTIEVGDTGKGIDPKDINKIFDRFFRVEGSEAKGSGIGLALTKELVELHNGQISLDSNLGKGTTFKLRLPYTLEGLPKNVVVKGEEFEFKENKSVSAIDLPLNEDDQDIEINHDNRPRILIVEDNEDLRSFIGDILKPHYEIITANNGLQGERLAFEHIPELIITDLMMPKKDGLELCNSVKQNIKTSHIPLIMLTAKAGQENKIEGLSQGADAYLTKPFDDQELKVMIKNLLNARQKVWEHFKSLELGITKDLDLRSIDDEFMQKVLSNIKENIDNEYYSVEDLAASVGFSRSQLHRKLKALVDKSASQLITEIRLNHAKVMLEKKVGSVSEIAYSVGYTNMSYFTKSFKEKFGELPSKI